jgi:hypothetical protein
MGTALHMLDVCCGLLHGCCISRLAVRCMTCTAVALLNNTAAMALLTAVSCMTDDTSRRSTAVQCSAAASCMFGREAPLQNLLLLAGRAALQYTRCAGKPVLLASRAALQHIRCAGISNGVFVLWLRSLLCGCYKQ